VELVASKILKKQLELVIDYDPAMPISIKGDNTRLRQILVNLLSNAVKFTDKGEVGIEISGTPGKDGYQDVHIIISDTGIGIPGDRMEHIFNSFTQADASTTRKYGGTGLGLAISKKLAEMMGGTITATSTIGRGSEFHVLIRAETLPEPCAESAEKLHDSINALMIIPGKKLPGAMERHLRARGIDVLSLPSAREALKRLEDGRAFDLIIMDLEKDWENSVFFLNQLTCLDFTTPPRVLTIGIPGMQIPGKNEKIKYAHMNKPIKPAVLHKLIQCLMSDDPESVNRDTKALFDPSAAQKRPLRILIAEDIAINQKVALRMLAHMGYRADVAANGREVMQALERQYYDLILMDIQMPEMDGIETTVQIRDRLPKEFQPFIVAVTAGAFSEDRDRCLRAGIDEFLSKPVKAEKLIEVLSRCPALQAPAHEPPPGSMIVDFTVINNLRSAFGENAQDILEEMIRLYITEAAERIANITRSLAAANYYMAAREAHGLKGSSTTIGAAMMARLAVELEGQVKSGAYDDLERLLAEIALEFEKTTRALRGLAGTPE